MSHAFVSVASHTSGSLSSENSDTENPSGKACKATIVIPVPNPLMSIILYTLTAFDSAWAAAYAAAAWASSRAASSAATCAAAFARVAAAAAAVTSAVAATGVLTAMDIGAAFASVGVTLAETGFGVNVGRGATFRLLKLDCSTR